MTHMKFGTMPGLCPAGRAVLFLFGAVEARQWQWQQRVTPQHGTEIGAGGCCDGGSRLGASTRETGGADEGGGAKAMLGAKSSKGWKRGNCYCLCDDLVEHSGSQAMWCLIGLNCFVSFCGDCDG